MMNPLPMQPIGRVLVLGEAGEVVERGRHAIWDFGFWIADFRLGQGHHSDALGLL